MLPNIRFIILPTMILLLAVNAFAEVPISGQVFTTDGNPLAYAVIADTTGQSWTIADENGFFTYNNSNSVNFLSVARYGYQTEYLQLSNKKFYTIALMPIPIAGGPIIVTGTGSEFSGQISNVYSKMSISSSTLNIFQQLPGIIIRSYGGKAGIINLSTNGSPTANTKVLLGDVDLTSAQNGETDLSQISPILISQIRLANSPGIFYGSGAADGVLKINPIQNITIISAATGSFGYSSLNAKYAISGKNLATNISIGHESEDGNFDYIVENSNYTRQNNDFERNYLTLTSQLKLSEKNNVDALFLESRNQRGVSGTITFPSPLARRDDNLRLGSVSFNRLHPNGFTKLLLSSRTSVENYTNPNPTYPTKSIHKIYSNSFKIRHRRNFLHNISSNLIFQLQQEKIKSNAVGNHARNMQALALELQIPIFQNFKYIPAARVDNISNRETNITKSMRIRFLGWTQSQLEYYIGTGFRNPTFNDLYWNPGGNPDLKPEESWSHTLKYKLFFNNNFGNYLYFYLTDKHTDDLIQWAPSSANSLVWQPQNIARSRRSNLTIGTQIGLDTIPLQISAHGSYQTTKDIEKEQALLYAPKFSGFLGAQYKTEPFMISGQTHFNGKRLIDSNQNYLPGYWHTNISMQYSTQILGNHIEVIFDLTNPFDLNYMSINGYPEPGRAINISIKYELAS